MNISAINVKPIINQGTISSFFQPKIDFLQISNFLRPIRRWCDELTINNPTLAHRICRLIPAQCPFARTITLLDYKILTIPPLCKLNPLYEEFVFLRFRALCYLADDCGEDIQQYC